MKRNWLRGVIGGLSFTSALFIFQACYGTPQDFGNDIYVQGQVKSLSTGIPIPGIKVSVADNMQYEMTDEEGRFGFYTANYNRIKIEFTDIDSLQNGHFLSKDTVLNNVYNTVYLNIDLEEK